MKRPDLLILVAILQFLAAFLFLGAIAAIAAYNLPEVLGLRDNPADTGAIFVISISLFIVVCLFCSSLAGGIGILKTKKWGRIISMVNATIGLLNIPIGTVIGVFILMYLSKTEVREYFEINA
jgi:hypothetical protein